MRRRAGALLVGAAILAAVLVMSAALRGPAPTRDPRCGDVTAADYRCLQQRYLALAAREGAPAALAALRADRDARDLARANCHQLAHVIAHAAAGPIADEGASLCGWGFDAGRIEAAALSATVASPTASPTTICQGPRRSAPRSNAHHTCAHAVGHALLDAGGDLTGALSGCNRMADAWERHGCAGGVFMEHLNRSTTGPRPIRHRLTLRRPLALCATMPRRHRSACYGQLAAFAVGVAGGSPVPAFAHCRAIRRTDWRAACERGIGTEVAAGALASEITGVAIAASAAVACELGPDPAARAHCAVGAVRMLIDHTRDPEVAAAVCRPMAEPGARACRHAARTHLASISRSRAPSAGA